MATLILALAPAGQQTVNLVNEDATRLMDLGHCKQRPHNFLPLAHPLGSQTRGTDREEGAVYFVCNTLPNEGLACTRRTKQQQALGRLPEFRDDVRTEKRIDDNRLTVSLANSRPAMSSHSTF